ncbi:MAG: hypothetical protein KIT36_09705 [Alphaproteobacteria bacterium]|nr:hypothetical protein [Alphaproteobacteria bacterium]
MSGGADGCDGAHVGLASPRRPIARVYHLAEADNWPSIERHGLLSARALLDLPGVSADDRRRVAGHRAARTVLANGTVVRDQSPMPPAALRGCLHGMTPAQWYALLNAKVFFWIDRARLDRHLHACRRSAQVLMVLDAAALLDVHAARASVTPFNTGNARRRPASRGRATFVPYRTWCESGWRHEAEALGTRPRSPSHPPAELAIADAVPDALRFVIELHHVAAGERPALPAL